VTIAIAGATIAIALIAPLHDVLVLDRGAVASGQLWRVATGSLVHFSPSQLLYDLLVVAAAGSILERGGRSIGGAVVTSAIAVGVAVLLLEPQLERYGGLSGIACTLTTMLAVDAVAASGLTRAAGAAMLALSLAKLWWELRTGSFVFVADGGTAIRAVPIAHAAGTAVGAIAAVLSRLRAMPRSDGPAAVGDGKPPLMRMRLATTAGSSRGQRPWLIESLERGKIAAVVVGDDRPVAVVLEDHGQHPRDRADPGPAHRGANLTFENAALAHVLLDELAVPHHDLRDIANYLLGALRPLDRPAHDLLQDEIGDDRGQAVSDRQTGAERDRREQRAECDGHQQVVGGHLRQRFLAEQAQHPDDEDVCHRRDDGDAKDGMPIVEEHDHAAARVHRWRESAMARNHGAIRARSPLRALEG
jgi:rhomboid family GlyGly-CTERM serine protease